MTFDNAKKSNSPGVAFKHIFFIPDYFLTGDVKTSLQEIDSRLTSCNYLTEDWNMIPWRSDPETGVSGYSIPGMSHDDVEAMLITNDFINAQLKLPAYERSNINIRTLDKVKNILNKNMTTEDINNVLMSKVKKPYDIYVYQNLIGVVIHEGFFNMLLSAHREFKILILSDLVNEFGKNYGLDKLHKSILFNVYSLYI